MAYENHLEIQVPHRVVMEERTSLSVSGVVEVERFDENEILMSTPLGTLTVRGEELHINSLSIEVGELDLQGRIESLTYTENKPQAKGFFNKVFR